MKKALLFLSVIFVAACSSVKKTQEALNTGNYDQAIAIAIKNLKSNKTKKNRQPYVLMLEEAFVKAADRDLKEIEFLKKDGHPANLESIYETYLRLENRQELIKPLLPLPVLDRGRNATFRFNNYTDEIIASKDDLSDYLYKNAKGLLTNATNKLDYRAAYDDLSYLDRINPGFKNVRQLMDEASFKGTDFVLVNMKNQTQMVIPQRLEEDLLNFDTYGLDDKWTVYHGNKLKQIKYDFGMEIALRDINITPEQIREKQVIKEKQVKDGWKYLHDDDGNIVKDSLGNNIKVDNFKTVRCELYQFTQFKATQVTGMVKFKDLRTKQQLESFPINSEFVFEHVYADYDGDKRALDDHFLGLIGLRAVPFPSNEQMVFDTGEDLKEKIKFIITRNKLRN
ncbi:hypothetical protein ACFQ1M_09240 [Sungkyunkwania multivorans]|uniref:Lipoprotein n=1 Tax=Sungkyunkwania multivorans TaxID=1173618 RepID=A0ABW3CZY8_9FLAO